MTQQRDDSRARSAMGDAAEDINAITNLLHSYAELLDTGHFDALVDMFDFATVRLAGGDHEFRGRGAVRSLIADPVQLYDGIPGTKHVITNLVIELDTQAPQAFARSYYTALQSVSAFPLQPILAGRWHDRLEKVDGQWRLVDRIIYNDLMGDLSRHIKGVPATTAQS